MALLRCRPVCFALVACIFCASFSCIRAGETPIPAFGRDTVLVWKIENLNFNASFIARIAAFSPDRFLEWEDGQTQGTVLIPQRDILEARGYDTSGLFVTGMDKKSNNVTTLWLSRRIFRELKEKKTIKLSLDGVPGKFTSLGDDRIAVEVNRSMTELPIIKIADDRGAEWSFLDREDNPLMIRHRVRNYSQTLIGITTDRQNTLRWIKGQKLQNLGK